MANNYCQSSSLVRVPPGKLKQAQQIVDRVAADLEADENDGYVGFLAEVMRDGVWIWSEENITPEHVEYLVRALVDELDLDGVFVCSWANTCSKPRIEQFGGGAFALRKGEETVWIDAASEAEHQLGGNP